MMGKPHEGTNEIRDKEELVSCIWMKKLWEDAGHLLDQITYLQERCKEVIDSPGGPYMYGEALEQDLLFRRDLEEAFASQDFDGCRVLLIAELCKKARHHKAR